jgi:hypothetical protein
MQPVGIIQNLTNDIQGPTGVNFVEQDFQFQARLLIRNRVSERFVYNRSAKISGRCLKDVTNVDRECSPDGLSEVRYVRVAKNQNVYTVQQNLDPTNINGIPPYGFVRVKFPVFEPNENIEDQLGLMELIVVAEAVDPITGVLIGDH